MESRMIDFITSGRLAGDARGLSEGQLYREHGPIPSHQSKLDIRHEAPLVNGVGCLEIMLKALKNGRIPSETVEEYVYLENEKVEIDSFLLVEKFGTVSGSKKMWIVAYVKGSLEK